MRADRSHPPDSWFTPCAELASSVADTEPFSVIVDQVGPAVVVVSVVGEIDMLTESSLHDDLRRALATHPERLIIDLSRVSFLSAAGLSVLINAKHTATHQGTALQLRVPDRRVMARSLAMAGLDYQSGTSPPATCVPHPRESDRDAASVLTAPASVVETGPAEYAYLVPLQRRYAELAFDDPERRPLLDTLISGYLRVAEHIARRFAGRGEPLDDLVQIATVGLINAVTGSSPPVARLSWPSRYRRSPVSYVGTFATTVGQSGYRADSKTSPWPSRMLRPSYPRSSDERPDPARSPNSWKYPGQE